ncbi:TraM recognition domain-containing protein [Bradyrhizobium symbiodeficiens]|uniref:TraM recognition domain-containing protein n=1 Tax=Bradyrhizobium symbiodeficiens TaxID=1404367 RepID=UPI003BB05779
MYPKTASSIARLVLNDCKAIANSSKAPLFITLEERSVYPGPQSTHLLSLGRSSQIQLLNLCQTLSDLRVGSPELGDAAGEQVIASTNVMAFFQLNTAEDAEAASRLIGTTMQKQFTAQTQGGQPTGMSSSRQVYEFKFHPDQLKLQRVGQAVLLDKNRGTVRKVIIRRSRI